MRNYPLLALLFFLCLAPALAVPAWVPVWALAISTTYTGLAIFEAEAPSESPLNRVWVASPPDDSLPDVSRAAVLAPIQRLFSAMESRDTLGLAASFHPEARLSSVVAREGKIQTQSSNIPSFIARLASSPAGDLLEELHYAELRIDGDLATAWTPYTFVYKGQISHCGTNSFQLARTGENGQWQIYSILDSRYNKDCSRQQAGSAEEKIRALADNWHLAATEADADRYFGLMMPEAIFIGTDASEHWTKSAFETFARPYFDKGKAWDFKASDRHIYVFPDENIAYWDEQLDTWMGKCRGTGIAKRQPNGSWLIQHYTLSVAVPNEKIQEFIELVKN